MLEQLRSIVQKVNAAKDLRSALDIIVHRSRVEVASKRVGGMTLFAKHSTRKYVLSTFWIKISTATY